MHMLLTHWATDLDLVCNMSAKCAHACQSQSFCEWQLWKGHNFKTEETREGQWAQKTIFLPLRGSIQLKQYTVHTFSIWISYSNCYRTETKHFEGWEQKRSNCFFTYINLDLFHSQPSIWSRKTIKDGEISKIKKYVQRTNYILCKNSSLAQKHSANVLQEKII